MYKPVRITQTSWCSNQGVCVMWHSCCHQYTLHHTTILFQTQKYLILSGLMSIYVNISRATTFVTGVHHTVTFHYRTFIYVRLHAKTWHNHTCSIVTTLNLICSDVDRFLDLYYQSDHLFIPTPEFDQNVELLSLRLWPLNFPFICVNCHACCKLLLEICGLCDIVERLRD